MAAREDIENEDELYGTYEERAEFVIEVKDWAQRHGNPNDPIICVFLPNKEYDLADFECEFTPLDLARDIEEGTAIAVAIADIIMYRSKIMRISPIECLEIAFKNLVV